MCSRRSTATILANRDGSPVAKDAAEWMAFDQYLTGIGSPASISFARHWHQMTTVTNTMNTSAKSTRGAVSATTRTSRIDPITTPDATAPVRRRGTLSAGSVSRRRRHATAPARTIF